MIVDPDAVDLDDGLKRSPLQGLLCALCDLLDHLDYFDPRKFKELKDLLDAINAILSKYKIVIEV